MKHWHDKQTASGKKIAAKLMQISDSIERFDASNLSGDLGIADRPVLLNMVVKLTEMAYNYDPNYQKKK